MKLTTFNAIGLIVIAVFSLIYFPFFYESKEKEIPCEVKVFNWKKDTDWSIEYKLKTKMVRQFPRSQCKTNNLLNKEWIFSRGPVHLLAPFRPDVIIPKTNKEIFLEE
jgi:hypothetical protein